MLTLLLAPGVFSFAALPPPTEPLAIGCPRGHRPVLGAPLDLALETAGEIVERFSLLPGITTPCVPGETPAHVFCVFSHWIIFLRKSLLSV